MTLEQFVQLLQDKDIRYKFDNPDAAGKPVIGICLGMYVWDYFVVEQLIPNSADITLRFHIGISTQSTMTYPSKGRGIERKKMLAKRMSINEKEI